MIHLVGLAAAGKLPNELGDPPAGLPTNASTYTYGGGLVGVQWTNGDTSAYTGVGRSGSSTVPPSAETYIASPGATSLETGESLDEHWWIRHYKNSQYGDWVYAPAGF